jgi:colanic acid biosynthesis glycosyl transferase WcaI
VEKILNEHHMRLLVVSQYFWPENFRINDLVAEMVKRGHAVTVLTGTPNYPEGKVFPDFRKKPCHYAEYAGASIVRVPMTVRGQGRVRLMLNYLTFMVSASVLGVWKLRGTRFDAIFTCQLSPVTVGIPAIILRSVKRAPMTFWVLDSWPDTLKAVGVVRSEFLLQLVGKLVAFIYKRSDLILAQSKSFISQIKQYAGNDHKLGYLPGWAEELYSIATVSLAAEVPLKPGGFNVMFAGNIGEAQDFPAILDAAERLKEYAQIRWLIIGDGRLSSWVKAEIENRGLQSNVLMLGRFPVERMPSFFKHAQALLVSLKDEPIFSMTIPGKLQSYLVSGLPVVAMLNGEGANLVVESQAGLACAAGDSGALAAAVLNLSRMAIKEREEMGRNGLALSLREFNRDELMNRLERWLEELAGGA